MLYQRPGPWQAWSYVLGGSSDYAQYDGYNCDNDQDVNDPAGIKPAKKANGPDDDQNDCDGIK